MRSAITVPFPEAAAFDGWRERTCGSKPSHGVPPHVTLLFPFAPAPVEDALVTEIDFDVLHSFDFHERCAQFAHAFVAIFAFRRYLDRFENRVIGADANPYVATAVTLACGYLGMKERAEPSAESIGSAYDVAYELPRTMSDALNLLAATPELARVVGERFATIYRLVKELEYDEFMKVISSWEREHLLLHV